MTPDALRNKVFAGHELQLDERLAYLTEFVGQLDERVTELERMVTELGTEAVKPDAAADR